MKKIFYRIYTAAFLGICLAPAVLTPFMKSDGSKEKRELGELPSVKTEDGKLNFSFFSEFETWFSEHFAFRQQLVNADGRLRSVVFGTSSNSDVIVGKDGWLFYGETADDFLHINCLDSMAIGNIAHNLRIMEKYCEDAGAEFVFFSAPNKNSLYPEYMPFNYIPSENTGNYQALTAALSGEDFYLDMKEALLGLNSATPLYHKTDTHWNNFGAYAGHSFIMTKLGRESCPVSGDWYIENDRLGDLAAMLYPAEKAKDAQLHNDYAFTYQYTSRFQALDDLNITTYCENGSGDLLMYRDSYGEAILPYMAECFNTAEFSRSEAYDLSGVGEGDTVIVEIVERNLDRLQKYAPVMAAPEADISDIAAEKCVESTELYTRAHKSFTHLFGVIPEEAAEGEEHRIYAVIGGKAYEAFNCFEDRLLGCEGESSFLGFSMYIPTEKINGDIKLVVENTGGRAFEIDLFEHMEE